MTPNSSLISKEQLKNVQIKVKNDTLKCNLPERWIVAPFRLTIKLKALGFILFMVHTFVQSGVYYLIPFSFKEDLLKKFLISCVATLSWALLMLVKYWSKLI